MPIRITILLAVCFLLAGCGERVNLDRIIENDHTPVINPDYAGITLPPNIAPLNFSIREAGERYYVRIRGTIGEALEISSRTHRIHIPLAKWQGLIRQNAGRDIYFDVYVKDKSSAWNHFKIITNHVAADEIDGYLTYRLLEPVYILWKRLGLYQRHLADFKETTIFHNRPLQKACINCHNYCWNSGEKMLVHIRRGPGTSMLLVDGDKIQRIDTTTDFNKSAGAYPAWYPDGTLLALSVNQVKQYFHGVGENRDVFDKASDLILYDVQNHMVTTCPQIASTQHMETWPAWSPDGAYLYFCSAPALRSDIGVIDQYPSVKYDLVRVHYDKETRQFGTPEIVLSSLKTGLSITQPRISPDGHYLLLCMASYGNFPVYRPDSDLYLFDLKTLNYQRLDINSQRSDSFHSWSSNSRWFVFSSKRDDGLCARPYFAYFDEQGRVHKPFILPQKDPEFYQSFTFTYNVPELSKSAVSFKVQKLIAAALDVPHTIKAALDPDVDVSKPAQEDSSPWLPVAGDK